MPKKTIAKSAKDGKIVSKKFAKENPDTTFETVAKAPVKAVVEVPVEVVIEAPPLTGLLALVGKWIDVDGQLAIIESIDPLRIMGYQVENGVQTNHEIELDLTKAVEVSDQDAFIRLA